MEKTKFVKWAEAVGQSYVAEKLGVSRQLVNLWCTKGKRPSDRRKLDIIKLTDGALTMEAFFLPEELGHD